MNLSKIKAFVFDIDGVMTNGLLLAMPDGDFLRQYDAKDGFAIRMAVMHGYHVAIITGGSSGSIVRRAVASGFPEDDVYVHSRDKVKDFRKFCEKHGLAFEEVMYMGDDLPDMPVMQLCGLPACPMDAVPEVRQICSFVCTKGGGAGAVREVIETVMSAQGEWNLDVSVYEKRF